ncbi:MAG: 50S ribosomal protein L21 [Candidatus Ancillula sp.]|jgi:large subunit ribosomal protein L21|nr:50S ribosomal protein L21 [Candidatus Ancillula sp.]
MTYAIVKTGANQAKVSVDDVIVVNRIKDNKGKVLADGAKVDLPAVLYVDEKGGVVADSSKLEKVKVTAEVLNQERGTKIVGMKYKNKTGYRKRWGHRQEQTRLKIVGIKA